jgi:hypothetical protein
MTSADVAEEILAGTPEAHARQEYECSFLAAVVGAYYTQELERVERDGRIRQLPWSPALEVVTAWDLGIADQTAIIFAQVHGPEVRIIDFYQHRGESLAHYAKVLSEKPYRYRDHFLPHDVENRLDDYGSGTTRREILLSLGCGRVARCPGARSRTRSRPSSTSSPAVTSTATRAARSSRRWRITTPTGRRSARCTGSARCTTGRVTRRMPSGTWPSASGCRPLAGRLGRPDPG